MDTFNQSLNELLIKKLELIRDGFSKDADLEKNALNEAINIILGTSSFTLSADKTAGSATRKDAGIEAPTNLKGDGSVQSSDAEAESHAVESGASSTNRTLIEALDNPEYWLIYFEDRDVPPEMFTDETAARHRYKRLLTNWNCHLFRRVTEPQQREITVIDRDVLLNALHDVAKQYLPPTSDYIIQRFADRIQHELKKATKREYSGMNFTIPKGATGVKVYTAQNVLLAEYDAQGNLIEGQS